MGPHFENASTKIGRNRLPAGYVVVLNDADRLTGVLCELLGYALGSKEGARPRLGVLFRLVSSADLDIVQRALISKFGAAAVLHTAEVFGLDETFHFVIDSEAVAHVWARHSDPVAEGRRGQVAITASDFLLLPTVLQTVNIVGFEVVKGMPRIIFERTVNNGGLVAVAEIQRTRRWLVLKTFYKKK